MIESRKKKNEVRLYDSISPIQVIAPFTVLKWGLIALVAVVSITAVILIYRSVKKDKERRQETEEIVKEKEAELSALTDESEES